MYDTYTPADLVDYQPKNFYLDDNGYAVHVPQKYGNTIFTIFNFYSDQHDLCKVVIDCTAVWQLTIRIDGKAVRTNYVNSSIYLGPVVAIKIHYSPDYQIVFRGASIYTGVKKTFIDRFPALGNAFTWVLSNLAMVFVIITDNSVLCLGLALFAAGFAIYFYKKIRN